VVENRGILFKLGSIFEKRDEGICHTEADRCAKMRREGIITQTRKRHGSTEKLRNHGRVKH
jgi:hypothetical protein